MAAYGDYQNEIYFAGLRGELPKLPVDFATLQERARQAMSPTMLNYVNGGCGNEHTQRWNVAAFDHWGLMPRMLRACAIPISRSTSSGCGCPRQSSWRPSASSVSAHRTDMAISRSLAPQRPAACR